jgi:hypothetical protein
MKFGGEVLAMDKMIIVGLCKALSVHSTRLLPYISLEAVPGVLRETTICTESYTESIGNYL